MDRSLRLGAVAGVAALAVALPGCGVDSHDSSTTGDRSATYRGSYPTGADDVVVSVRDDPGYTSAAAHFVAVERYRVMGDGTFTVATSTTGAHYATVRTGRLREPQLRQVLGRAHQAGLLASTDYSAPEGSVPYDLGTTSITVHADGHEWSNEAYALSGPTNDSSADTDERVALQHFLARLEKTLADRPQHPYVPTEIRIRAEAVDEVATTSKPWPVPRVKLTSATCVTADGAEARELVAALRSGDTFTQGGRSYDVYGAAVLPGQPGC